MSTPAPSSFPLKRNIKFGTRGPDALALKRALVRQGFGKGIALTRLFGPFAARNLKRWQKQVGLVADGVYGPESHRRMIRLGGFDDYGRKLMGEVKLPKKKAGLVDQIILTARTQLGVHEEPPGSNRGLKVRLFQSHTFLGGTGWPWCVAFVHYVFDTVGVSFPWKTASAYGFYDWAKQHGWTAYPPERGDIGVWNVGSGHANIVENVSEGHVHCVDGNHGDAVSVSTRPLSQARGFIRHPRLHSAFVARVAAFLAESDEIPVGEWVQGEDEDEVFVKRQVDA